MAKSTRINNGVGMLADMPDVVSTDGKLNSTQVGYIVSSVRSIIAAINGKLRFGDGSNSSQSGNIDGQTKEVAFVNANTDYEVPHALGRVPVGIIVLDVTVDGAVLRGGSRGSWNDTRIFVRCSQANCTGLFVIV